MLNAYAEEWEKPLAITVLQEKYTEKPSDRAASEWVCKPHTTLQRADLWRIPIPITNK